MAPLTISTVLLGVIALAAPSAVWGLHVVQSTSTSQVIGSSVAAYSIAVDSSNRVWIAGGKSNAGLLDAFAARFDSNLVFQTSWTFPNVGKDLLIRSIAPRPDGSMVFAGQFGIHQTTKSLWVGILSSDAALLASATVRNDVTQPDQANLNGGRGIVSHPNGSIYAVGSVDGTPQAIAWIGRFSPQLVLIATATISHSKQVGFLDVAVTDSGKIVAGGFTNEDSSGTDSVVAVFNEDLTIASSATIRFSSGKLGEYLWAATALGNRIFLGGNAGVSLALHEKGEPWILSADDQLGGRVDDFDSGAAGTAVSNWQDLAAFPPFGILSAGANWVALHSTGGFVVQAASIPVDQDMSVAVSQRGDIYSVGRTDTSGATGNSLISRWEVEPGSSALSGFALGISSVAWSWSVPWRYRADSYRVMSASAGVQLSTTSLRQFSQSGPAPNSTLILAVAGVNASGAGALSNGVTVYTLASVPETPTLAVGSAESLNVSWSTAGNSAGTPYSVYLSSGASPATNGYAGNRIASTTAGSTSFTGLQPGTTYFVALKATNGDGVDTALVSAGSAKTAVLATPTLSGGGLGVSSISWSWADVTGESGYRVVDGAGASLSGDLPAGTSVWVEAALSTNVAYGRRVVAFGGPEVSTSAAATVFTMAAPPQALAFDAVYASSFSVSWATNTNPAGTSYRLYVWEAAAGSTTLTTTASSAAATGLVGGATYFVTLEALNGDAVVTRGPPAASTATVPGGSAAAGSVIVIQLPGGQATVDVPASAFPPGVTVTVEPPGPLPTATGGTGLAGTGVGVRITASGAAQPQQRVAIGLRYRDADVAGLDTSRLLLARYDEARRVWVPLDSRVDTAAKRVTGTTDHFSLFQVMQAGVASGLDAPRAFPNPLRPSRGHTGVTFDTLPAGSRVRVYTLLGELVRDLTASGAGLAFWDGKNASGALVASGVYAVFIQGDGQAKTLKVAVQR